MLGISNKYSDLHLIRSSLEESTLSRGASSLVGVCVCVRVCVYVCAPTSVIPPANRLLSLQIQPYSP